MRDVAKATEYLQTATSYGLLPADASRRVQLVQVDITDANSIAPAIGNASKVRGIEHTGGCALRMPSPEEDFADCWSGAIAKGARLHVQASGVPESEALNISNPEKIDGDGTIELVDAAVAMGIFLAF